MPLMPAMVGPMNGRFFHARQVRKERRRGIFVKSRSESDEVGGGL
jgi:hypothetical protein